MSDFLPGLEGVPATKSAISYIDGEKGILSYRGYPLETLAENSSFEESTLLLLNGELPTQKALDDFKQELRQNYRIKYHIREMMRHFPHDGHPMDMLQTAVSSLGMFYPGTECLTGADTCEDLDYVRNMTVNIIAQMSPLVAMWQHIRYGWDPIQPRSDLSVAENLLYMFNGEEPDPLLAKIMDVCLILHAEHTLNASTFAALVAGSTLASPYSVISAAIGTLSGPLHGGANQRVVGMLQEIGSPDNVEAWVDGKLKNKEVIWGMGHREYKVKDPRATILHKLVEKLVEERGGALDDMFDTALKLEEVCADRLGHKGVYPNVDFYSGILYSEMGIPEDQFTALFAVARSAGWLAHWREQIANNRIYRPTQIYVGSEMREYVPMNQRG
ncbi:citrate synthase [Methylophaga sp. OBS1]|uniref:citrate synthase n=1 Tax=Methylophaga sp. OBS1 TaxID=2991933 RepID=UPI00224E852E|nr:citrate synthase [Methylophaga sp. OBS1]MCX4192850.1 citrate synthase [Methylophaga sp. OBS1]